MSELGICDGRIVIVTGAGRGIGRSHALGFAREGARVVVNDLGSALDGSATGETPADEVVAEIRAMGGEAVANGDDVADVDGARSMVQTAIDTFGGLDVLVNNAGIIRDKMLINIDPDEFDLVVRVHLRGHFLPMKFAGTYWREQSKAGAEVDARIVNTSSAAGLFGNIGQAHYASAKAGINALTRVAAVEMVRYGVMVNAIAPTARTRMTETVMQYVGEKPEDGFDKQSPENVSPLVVWLGSPASKGVTGQVFRVGNGLIGVAESWKRGPTHDFTAPFSPTEAGEVVQALLPRLPDDIPGVIGAR